MASKRGYKVKKYSDVIKELKRQERIKEIETYEPKRKVELKREHATQAVPLIVRIFGVFLVLGGWISFFTSSFIMAIKGVFGFKKKVDDMVVFDKRYIDIGGRKIS